MAPAELASLEWGSYPALHQVDDLIDYLNSKGVPPPPPNQM